MTIAQAMQHYAETEPHRHATEVRHVASLPDNYARTRYLAGVEKMRSKEAADRLRADTWTLMQGRDQ